MRGTRVAAVAVAAVLASLLVAGPAQASNIGEEGCSPGYWKNHPSNWEENAPGTVLDSAFDFGGAPAAVAQHGDATFLEALRFKGGPGLDGAARILLRAATTATLNAAHEGVGYPYRRLSNPFHIRKTVSTALASGDRRAMLDLAGTLDAANNLGCPLS